MSVAVNNPKTPVTKGSKGVAMATVPNVCKMPGPPAPFVPAPLPNFGKSGESPKGYTKKVEVEGKEVAIKGATFGSKGDAASKGTGGGLVSANTHGPTKFVGPGSMDVKFEGKNVQLLSDPMLNNCGPSGSPPNSATVVGLMQGGRVVSALDDMACPMCGKKDHKPLGENKATEDSAKALSEQRKNAPGNAGPTMIGVVRCRCGKEYTANSGKPWVTEDKIRKHVKDRSVFRTQWGAADKAYKKTKKPKFKKKKSSTPAAYPPGNCAAQKAIIDCLNNGGIPAKMSERYFSPGPGSKKMGLFVAYRDRKGGEPKLKQFKHGDSVPPCKTCEAILPMLLCFTKDDKCGK